MRADSSSLARAAARKLVDGLRIRDPVELDVELVAAHCGAYVIYRPLRRQEGHLLRSGDRALIVVDSAARQQNAKWRFVIAHELGHFLRHPELDQLKMCSTLELGGWYRTSGFEAEANQFAAELLMPERMFAPMCDRNRPSLHDVDELSRRFRVSMSATALRFVALSPEPCATVMSKAGRITWLAATRDFGLRLERGYRLGRDSYAGDLFAGKSVDDDPQPVAATAWTDDPAAIGVDLYEHSRMMAKYKSVISFLWRGQDQAV